MTAEQSAVDGQPPNVGLDLIEAIYTTRAMRRLKPDPVPVDLLYQVVEAATMGPTGSYRQNWRFYVVTDRDKIEALGQLWSMLHQYVTEHVRETLPDGIAKSVEYLGAHFGESPAVIFVGGTEVPAPDAFPVMHTTFFGSLFPAAQNLMLAARAHGLGTTLTTLILAVEDQVKPIIGAPEDVRLVACIPIGYPKGSFGRPPRNPVAEVAFLDGKPFAPPSGG